MKKLLVISALVGTLGLAGYQVAAANGYGPGFGGGYGYCGNYGYGGTANFSKFRDASFDIRKELATKQAELEALYRQDNPDAKQISSLTGDIVDLQNNLDKIAEKFEIDRGMRGPGYAMGYGMGYGSGMMGYGGRGYGRHMMDW